MTVEPRVDGEGLVDVHCLYTLNCLQKDEQSVVDLSKTQG